MRDRMAYKFLDPTPGYSDPAKSGYKTLNASTSEPIWGEPDRHTLAVDAVAGWSAPEIYTQGLKPAVPSNQVEFEASSWSNIKNLEADDINKLIELGVYKTEQIGNEQIQFQLVSGAQYTLSSGSGQNKMVFLAKNLLPTAPQMNTVNKSTTWKTSLVKQKLDETYFGQLPEDLQKEIVEVKLPCFSTPYEYNSNVAPSLEYVNSKLFIPSSPEIYPKDKLKNKADYPQTDQETTWEGKPFKWYETHTEEADRIKNYKTSASYWWLRSPSHYDEFWRFDSVNIIGYHSCNVVTSTYFLVAAFCL